jgi:hypothetical protein
VLIKPAWLFYLHQSPIADVSGGVDNSGENGVNFNTIFKASSDVLFRYYHIYSGE